MAISSTLQITPLPTSSRRTIGAIATGIDLNKLSDIDFNTLHDALYKHQVIVIKDSATCTPKSQYELTRRFDPTSTSYGHGKTIDAKKSILHPDLKTIPHQPQVQVIGNGFVAAFEGLQDIRLRHPHHATFHQTRIPEAEDADFTRFYRWHIDAALYDLNPPRVTTLMAVKVPKGRTQTLRYDDGSGEEMSVPLGTTAFVSGEDMYARLTAEEQEFVRTTKVRYAAHPYIWMSRAKSNSTGLGLVSEGLELSESELPSVEKEKVKVLPMVWRNPVTGKLALQIHPSAVQALVLGDGTVVEDLAEVRRRVYELQRPGISPEFVYAHDWEEGDMVLFNNQGVIHSVVGAFKEDEVRIFRQCNLAASEEPVGA